MASKTIISQFSFISNKVRKTASNCYIVSSYFSAALKNLFHLLLSIKSIGETKKNLRFRVCGGCDLHRFFCWYTWFINYYRIIILFHEGKWNNVRGRHMISRMSSSFFFAIIKKRTNYIAILLRLHFNAVAI